MFSPFTRTYFAPFRTQSRVHSSEVLPEFLLCLAPQYESVTTPEIAVVAAVACDSLSEEADSLLSFGGAVATASVAVASRSATASPAIDEVVRQNASKRRHDRLADFKSTPQTSLT